MAHNFACAATIGAEGGFRPLAGFADTLAIATGTIDLTVDTIGAWYGLAFIGGIGIDRIGDWHALLANAIKDVGDSLVDGAGEVFGLFLEKWLLLGLYPVRDIATSATGGAAFLGAPMAVGADVPAATSTGSAEGATGPITVCASHHFVQPFQARAARGAFKPVTSGSS